MKFINFCRNNALKIVSFAICFGVIITIICLANTKSNDDNLQLNKTSIDKFLGEQNGESTDMATINNSQIDSELTVESTQKTEISTTQEPSVVTTTTTTPKTTAKTTTTTPATTVKTTTASLPVIKEIYNSPHARSVPNIFGTSQFTYYINPNKNNSIYKMDNNGDYNKKICENAWQIFGAVGDTVYYQDASDYCIYSIKENGSNKTKILSGDSYGVYFNGEYIFYVNGSDYNVHLYKIKLDGTNNTLVCKEFMDGALYCDGYIYFRNNAEARIEPQSKDNTLYRVNVVTSKVEKLGVQAPYLYYIKNNDIYYATDDGICVYSLTSKTNTEIYKASGEHENGYIRIKVFYVENDWVYFRENAGIGYYKIKTDGTSKAELTDTRIMNHYDTFFTSKGWGLQAKILKNYEWEYYLITKDGKFSIKL